MLHALLHNSSVCTYLLMIYMHGFYLIMHL